jgi:hypothetical protein
MNGPLAGAPRRVYTLFLGAHAWSAPIGNGEHCATSFTSQKISARPPAQTARAAAFDRDVSPIRLAPWPGVMCGREREKGWVFVTDRIWEEPLPDGSP